MPRKKSAQSTEEERMSTREYAVSIWRVITISFSISKMAVVFKVISAVLNSVLPLVTAFFAAQTTTEIAAAFGGDQAAKTRAIWYVVATALLGLITAVQSSLGNYIDQIVRYRVESKVSDMLYERFALLDFWRYDDKETADLYEKAQDFSRFFAYVFDRVAQLFQSLFGVAAAVIGLGLITPWLSVALLVAILPGMYTQYRLSRFQIKHWRNTVVERRKQSYIEYNMIQPKIIAELRLYGLVKNFLAMRVKFRNTDQGGRLESERGFIKWRIASDVLETIVQLGSLVWAVLQIAAQNFPIGQFIYIQQLVSRALGSAAQFVTEFGAADEDLSKLKDYNDFMKLPTTQASGRKITKPIETIELKNVSFTYPTSKKETIKNISIKITRGSHIAIVGENGAGKSTLIKLLLGFYEVSSGEILLDGVPIADYDITSWHTQVSVLLQSFSSFQFATIGDNVTFGDAEVQPTKSRINRALEAAEAREMVEELPRGLDSPAATWFEEDGGVELSGGQWQRIGLARNFYRQAPIIILDEPTSAIDAHAEANIFDRLFDANNKQTVITISHRLTTIENADRIYVLSKGELVQVGTHKELVLQKDGQYVHMFRRQLKKA
ncbi:ABC transporter ATP-binding protein [Candidatus Saccharibacteria bacterium]|nr:ABC transporter ATP-binding protein [Candidatus Saccharibacteria bacterium]